MSVLDVCKEAARLMRRPSLPSVIYTANDTFAVELGALVNQASIELMREHDWTFLKTLATFTGDGSTTSFAKPDGYDRMVVNGKMYSSRFATPLSNVVDTNLWLDMQIRDQNFAVPEWIIIGNTFQFNPAPADAEAIKFYYISKYIAALEAAPTTFTKAKFTLDTDVPAFNEDLLTYEIIWRWRKSKGLDYADELQDANERRAKLIGHDQGARIIAVGRTRWGYDANLAYPREV